MRRGMVQAAGRHARAVQRSAGLCPWLGPLAALLLKPHGSSSPCVFVATSGRLWFLAHVRLPAAPAGHDHDAAAK